MSFNNVVGQEAAKRILKDELKSNRVSHAYLFLGADGLGKKELALEFVKALLCPSEGLESCDECIICRKIEHQNHADVRLLTREEGSRNIKIDQIRNLQQEIIYKPYEGKRKTFIIDDADKMTLEAANSLLRTLEEPPDYAVLILLAEEINQLLPTIISRCQQIYFHSVAQEKIKQHLKKFDFSSAEASLYSRLAEGSPGVALELVQDEDYKEIRTKVIDFLIDLQNKSLVKIFKQVNDLEKYLQQDFPLFDLISSWYRDIILCIEGNNKQIVNIDYLSEIKQLSLENSVDRLTKNISYLNKIKDYVDRNVNKSLALQVLMIKLRSGRM